MYILNVDKQALKTAAISSHRKKNSTTLLYIYKSGIKKNCSTRV